MKIEHCDICGNDYREKKPCVIRSCVDLNHEKRLMVCVSCYDELFKSINLIGDRDE